MSTGKKVIGVFLSVCFLSLMFLHRDWVMDDAFIIYRYSRHLVQGHGLVWNAGEEDPVEGYTSFSWVILNAVPEAFHADPAAFSKILSGAFALAAIWMLLWTGRRAHWGLEFIFAAAVGLSPCMAFTFSTGLETSLACLLLMSCSLWSIRAMKDGSRNSFIVFFGFCFLALLTRPDAGAFVAPAFAVMLLAAALRKDKAALKAAAVSALPFLGAGVFYLWWRVWHFNQFFPNSFHVKMGAGDGFFNPVGLLYLKTFVLEVLLPYAVLCFFLFIRDFERERFICVLPSLCGFFFFALYNATVFPVQNQFWRFMHPGWAALLAASLYYFSGRGPSAFKNRFAPALLSAAFAFWSLFLLPFTLFMDELLTQRDRVIIGKRLSDLEGSMIVSESGALPYYSGWRSADTMGLTYERVAREGLTVAALEDFNPDLFAVHVTSVYVAKGEKGRIFTDYLVKNNFVALASVHKAFGHYHFYFARRDSPLFDKIARRVTGAEGVEYGNLRRQLQAPIPIYEKTGSP